MKTLLLVLLALPALAFAQGALTPPGAPAPSMKSLDQIEPRTTLGAVGTNTATLTITQPGAYVLMGNVTVTAGNGITISAQNVTLDLNGFTVSSTATPATGTGIFLPTGSNFTIRNGHIRGTSQVVNPSTFTVIGFQIGIDATVATNVRIEQVSVDAVADYGISLYDGSGVIESCSARYCGTTGLRASQVLDSIALKCGGTAIYAGTARDVNSTPVANGIASNCTGESLDGGRGIFATTATNCYGTSISGWGLDAQEATNCHGATKTGTRGLNVSSTATGCTGMIGPDGNDLPGSVPSVPNAIALFAETANNCTGTITLAGTNSCALQATVANTCTGRVTAVDTGATGTSGLRANIAMNSLGNCPAGTGLFASATATGCQGVSSSGIGLSANGVATNCAGTSKSGLGLQASSANTCFATTASGLRALSVYGTASGCYGLHSGNGVAISAAIAIGCVAQQGTIVADNRYNMP